MNRRFLPPAVLEKASKDPAESDFYIRIQEFIPHFKLQLRNFARHAGKHFVLTAPGHPEIKAKLSGKTITNNAKGQLYQLFGVRIDSEDRQGVTFGVDYTIRPINTSETYRWSVKDGVVLKAGPSAR